MTHFNATAPVQKAPLALKKQGALYKTPRFLLSVGASALVLGLLLCLESAQASNIEESLAKIQSTSNGPLLKAGMTLGTVIGTVTAAVKHSVGMALVVMGIGAALSIYMNWLNHFNFAG